MSCTTTWLTELDSVQNIIDKGVMIIQEYAWLLDSYVLDYYTESHWEKVPDSWLKTLVGIDLPELARFVDSQSPKTYTRVWPLSLLSLRESVAQLSIPRQKFQRNSRNKVWLNICCSMSATSTLVEGTHLNPQLGQESNINSVVNLRSTICQLEESNVTCSEELLNANDAKLDEPSGTVGLKTLPYLTHPKLRNLFNKHVNPKKRHEIAKIARITAETAQNSGCRFVVDVGSGRGHLARMLAYGYGLRVCCLEAQTALVNEATRFDLELENTVSKHLKPEELGQSYRPVHLNLTLSHDTSPQEIVEGLKTVFGIPLNETVSFGIVGLHPCGDLASILLGLFVGCPEAVFINIVGCCFMKLTTEKCRSTANFGYPMSNYLLMREDSYELSYIARELACHALESYCERLQEGKFSDLKVHCYRATLEEIILKNWPSLKHSSIKSVKYSKNMTFSEYCDAALSKLAVKVPLEDTVSNKTAQNLLEWKQVVTFFTLRLLLAPLVETVILLDRLLYLRENEISSVLVPVFDPKISPRNHVLIANKRCDTVLSRQ